MKYQPNLYIKRETKLRFEFPLCFSLGGVENKKSRKNLDYDMDEDEKKQFRRQRIYRSDFNSKSIFSDVVTANIVKFLYREMCTLGFRLTFS